MTSFSLSTYSQLTFGLKGGVSIATWDARDTEFRSISGYIVGTNFAAVLDIGIYEDVSLLSEINLIQKGYTGILMNNMDLDINFKLNYLQLPVHAKYSFGNDKIGGFILAGAYLGFGISSREESCLGENCSVFSRGLTSRNPGWNRPDWGISIGGGLLFNERFFVDVRYGYGFLLVMTGVNSRNRGIEISGGYFFGK